MTDSNLVGPVFSAESFPGAPATLSPRRVLIADDSPVVRQMLGFAIEDRPAMIAVVGEAADGEAAVHMIDEHRPDALIIDNHMPVMCGVEAIRLIRGRAVPVEIVMFSSDPSAEEDALAAGADAFFLKGAAGPADLVDYLLDGPTTTGPGTVGHAVAEALGHTRTSTGGGLRV